MGASLTNFQVRSASKAKVVAAVKELIAARAYVSKASKGWVGVYDEQAENQRDEEILRIAKGLSEKLRAAVFAFLVHDSDIFQYWLFDDGHLQDQFNSDPDYFSEVSPDIRSRVAGNTKLLARYCKKQVDESALKRLLAPSGSKATNPEPEATTAYVFAEDQLSAFAALFEIDAVKATLGFEALAETDAEDPAEIRSQFQLVTAAKYKTVFKQNQSLIEAAHSGNAQEVERLLSAGVDPNARDDVGQTPLMIAFEKGNARVIRSLLQTGADIRAKSFGGTMIAYAASSGSPEVVELALESGADVFATDQMGRTALITALCGDSMFMDEIIDLLVKAGADVNQASDVQFSMHREFERGVTPLIYAARFGNVPAAKKLLALGARPDAKDANGDDAKTYAANKLNHMRNALQKGLRNSPEVQPALRFLEGRMADLETIIELLSR